MTKSTSPGISSTTSYKCDTCLRLIKLVDATDGIGFLNKCMITQGCVGQIHPILNKTEQKQAKAIPPSVTGLQDWAQRKVLFDFTQAYSSTTWTIDHNMDTSPIVVTYDKLGKQIFASTKTDVTRNRTVLEFDEPQIGTAQCIATASSRSTATTVVNADDTMIQLTTFGTLTLATLTNNPINITMTFEDTLTGEIVIVNYDDIPADISLESPWASSQQVMIANRYYFLRSFNLRHTPEAAELFNSGRIATGVTVTIEVVGGKINDTFVLLTNSPYTAFDRNLTQCVDLAIPKSTIIFNSGDLMLTEDSKSLRNMYPPISYTKNTN